MDDVTARGPRGAAFRLGLLLWVTYAYFIPSPSWNPNSRFDLTLALVEQYAVHIDAYHANTGDKAHHNEHRYSDKAPGVSFLAAPAYAAFRSIWILTGKDLPAVKTMGRDGKFDPAAALGDGSDDVLVNPAYRWGQYVASVFTSALAGASLGVMMLLAAMKQGRCQKDATAIATALCLGTLIFPYSTTLYGHICAAALAFGGFYILWFARIPSGRRFFLSGLLCATAAACEWPVAMIAAAVGSAAIVRWRNTRRAFLWPLGAAIPALLVLAYNNAAFGGPFAIGYAALERSDFAEPMSAGFMGIGWPSPTVLFSMLFGRARGLLYTSPVLVLAAWGLMRRTTTETTFRTTAATTTAAFLVLCSGYFMWWGGAAFGPRHVIPALPFWCMGLIVAWPNSSTRPWLGHLVFAAFALSVINMTLGTAVGPEAPLGRDILFRYAYPLAARGRIPAAPGASNIGRLLGLPRQLSIVPLMILWGVYIVRVSRKTKGQVAVAKVL